MTDSLPGSPIPAVPGKPPFYKNKIFIILLFFIFETIYTLLLLNFPKTKPQSSAPSPVKNSLLEEELPISSSLLKNPVVYQWAGSVRGTLVAKDEKSITLKDDKDNNIKIPLRVDEKDKNMAAFIDASVPSTKVREPMTVDQISLGSILRGSFFVIPGTKDKIVGSSFAVIKQATPSVQIR